MTTRSLLFVPGSRPERFAKALAAGADAVCIDLEDAVPPDGKDPARAAVLAFLQTAERSVGVRVNGVASPHFEADCRALAGAGPLAFVMIPKADRPEHLAHVRKLLGELAPPLWPVVETAEGLRNAWDIAGADGVQGVLFGGADFAAEIGTDLSWEALLYARGRLVAAAARAGVELLDVPGLDVRDAEGLEASTRRAKAIGFTGRACIHPDQVATVNAVFAPSAGELAHARRVLDAFDAAKGAAALLDGKLIELPVVRAARRILERAKA